MTVSKAIGFYMVIDDGFERMLEEIRSVPWADKRVDIEINYRGSIKGYTLQEFLQKLGFEE